MSRPFTVVPIGFVRGGRLDPADDEWGNVEATVVLDDRFPPDALAGLDEFSHADIVFVFDRVDATTITVAARRPRNNPAWPKVGIFAQRAKARPNRVGVTTCEIVAVEGREMRVRGLDAIDGTPVLDVKPYLREFAPRTPVRQPPWASELMAGYW